MRAPATRGYRPSPRPARFMDGALKAEAGFIETKYIGEGEVEVKGPTKRLYRMGFTEDRTVLVHPMDLNYLRALGVIP